jgi:predicted transcriptional regulator of viral defense system
MKPEEIEALYMTHSEVMDYLSVSQGRVSHLAKAGMIERLKGGIYLTSSVKAYRLKRGDKKAGRYPKDS